MTETYEVASDILRGESAGMFYNHVSSAWDANGNDYLMFNIGELDLLANFDIMEDEDESFAGVVDLESTIRRSNVATTWSEMISYMIEDKFAGLESVMESAEFSDSVAIIEWDMESAEFSDSIAIVESADESTDQLGESDMEESGDKSEVFALDEPGHSASSSVRVSARSNRGVPGDRFQPAIVYAKQQLGTEPKACSSCGQFRSATTCSVCKGKSSEAYVSCDRCLNGMHSRCFVL